MIQTLESRPLYSIGTVARLTGIKCDTLRVWERRYGLGASSKSAGGRREYNQSDLEHLQIVAAMVQQGTRIGDIANRDRKTLELMFNGAQRNSSKPLPTIKPRVLFVGAELAAWLDDHPGLLTNVAASIARRPTHLFLCERLDNIGEFDVIAVECDSLDHELIRRLNELRAVTNAGQLLLCHGNGSSSWSGELARNIIDLLPMPPQPAALGQHINRSIIDKTRHVGDSNAGELVDAKPQQFSNATLTAMSLSESNKHCACPAHISKLVLELNTFEAYAAQCGVDNWQDTAVHACVYAYTNQARWLMEKALQAVLEGERSSTDATS